MVDSPAAMLRNPLLRSPQRSAKVSPQGVHALHQRQSDFEERLPVRGQPDLGAAALEQQGIEFTLQSLYLQGNGRLAEIELFSGPGNAAGLGGEAERPELLQPVLLVVGGRLGFHPVCLECWSLLYHPIPSRQDRNSGIAGLPLIRHDDAVAEEVGLHLCRQVLLVPGVQRVQPVFVDEDGLLAQPFLPGFPGDVFEDPFAEFPGPGLVGQSFRLAAEFHALQPFWSCRRFSLGQR